MTPSPPPSKQWQHCEVDPAQCAQLAADLDEPSSSLIANLTTQTPPHDFSRKLGLVGMIDPLRAGVREAVADARAAGVGTIMVTGDHPVTALAISRDLGLAEHPDEVEREEDL